MEELISFLLYAAFFYLIMRFSCGAYMIHGSHRSRSNSRIVIDPVCGMKVAHDKGFSNMNHGKEYRFCSRNCLIKFDDNPEKFLNMDGEAL